MSDKFPHRSSNKICCFKISFSSLFNDQFESNTFKLFVCYFGSRARKNKDDQAQLELCAQKV